MRSKFYKKKHKTKKTEKKKHKKKVTKKTKNKKKLKKKNSLHVFVISQKMRFGLELQITDQKEIREQELLVFV